MHQYEAFFIPKRSFSFIIGYNRSPIICRWIYLYWRLWELCTFLWSRRRPPHIRPSFDEHAGSVYLQSAGISSSGDHKSGSRRERLVLQQSHGDQRRRDLLRLSDPQCRDHEFDCNRRTQSLHCDDPQCDDPEHPLNLRTGRGRRGSRDRGRLSHRTGQRQRIECPHGCRRVARWNHVL